MKTGLIKQATQKAKLRNTLNVSTIPEYINKILSLNISLPEKRKISKNFKKITGVTSTQIVHARNRHPYYKKLKNKNHNMRQTQRNKKTKQEKKRTWKKSELYEFLKLNGTLTDLQLAIHFKKSIPAINSIRRRINLGKKIMRLQKEPIWKKHEYILISELNLREKLKNLENGLKTKKSG